MKAIIIRDDEMKRDQFDEIILGRAANILGIGENAD